MRILALSLALTCSLLAACVDTGACRQPAVIGRDAYFQCTATVFTDSGMVGPDTGSAFVSVEPGGTHFLTYLEGGTMHGETLAEGSGAFVPERDNSWRLVTTRAATTLSRNDDGTPRDHAVTFWNGPQMSVVWYTFHDCTLVELETHAPATR